MDILVIILALVIAANIGDFLKNMFYISINRQDLRRLTRKEEKALRAEVEVQRGLAEERQQIIDVAADIFRDIEAADRAFPQLPQNTKERVDEFLEAHRPRLQLPKGKNPKKGDPKA